jgi:hypothetical protein
MPARISASSIEDTVEMRVFALGAARLYKSVAWYRPGVRSGWFADICIAEEAAY